MPNMNKTGYDEPLIRDLTKDNVNDTIRKLTENINRIVSQLRDLDGKAVKFNSNGDIVFDGNLKCNDGLFAANSIYLGKVKLSSPTSDEDTYVMQYNLANKQIEFKTKSSILALHAATHSDGGEDEVNHDDLAGVHQDVNTDATPTFAGLEVGDGTNKTSIGSDGTIVLEGNASVFDDIQISISNIRVPVANYPTERLYAFGIGSGVTFPVLGFAVNDYLYFDIQTSHAMKLESALWHHIHYTLPNTTDIGDTFRFQLDVIAAAYNGTWAVPTGSPFTAIGQVSTDDNTKHRILKIADIPGVNTTVSTLYKCKLTRIAAVLNEYGSEVYITFTDAHYEKDRLGSKEEYTQ